jgi:hypothetical protein
MKGRLGGRGRSDSKGSRLMNIEGFDVLMIFIDFGAAPKSSTVAE